MTSLLARVTTRHPIAVLLAWLAVILLGFGLSGISATRMTGSVGSVPGSESHRVADRLDRLQGATDGGTISAVLSGQDVTDPAFRAQIAAAVRDLGAMPGVAAVADPYRQGSGVSADHQALILPVTLAGGLSDDDQQAAQDGAEARLRQLHATHLQVSGGPLLSQQMNEAGKEGVGRAELVSLPLVLLLCLLVFGGLLAAGLPVLVAFCGIGGTFLSLLAVSEFTEISASSLQVTTMLGLGLAIDYALLVINRFREERRHTPDPALAVTRTVHAAGRTVFFSGLTVAVCLGGLLAFDSPFLRSMGLAAASVVLIDMAAAVTLVPAVLARFGHRLRLREPKPTAGRGFARIARLATSRPLLVAVTITAALAALALPLAGLRTTSGDARYLPAGSDGRLAHQALQAHFPQLSGADPVVVLLDGHGPAYDAFADRARALPQVSAAHLATLPDGTTELQLVPTGGSDDATALALVHTLRTTHPGLAVAVGGTAARVADFQQMLVDGLPGALAVVVGGILLLLFAFTGSLLIPVKTVLSTALSLGAAAGITTLVFQDGHGAGLLGGEGMGALDLVALPLIAAIAFGLAMDYEVFILARVREEWLRTGDPKTAVVTGLARTGRIVTSAAALILIVFAAFMTSGFGQILQIGLGLSLAVLIDATVVRMLLVPATMALLGRAAWWAPAPLRRLHARYGLREERRAEQGGEQGAEQSGEPVALVPAAA
ncbi:MMPL family transporter [Kitasatospora sp. NBC_01250]|uniref:MMPL family transporter n=1 Tax=unclassified Kitasatospora TaxID=2633591 RepID=UPI002E15201A|nr:MULTISPECIES: MMPL family transporter [unclassified Kitasatospora]WSJ67731.1 MMPL family transporter [Kitasatospora sp. NBC_01302]